jgi:hypothetical protein
MKIFSKKNRYKIICKIIKFIETNIKEEEIILGCKIKMGN